ncbi:MBL fold metallo-hydrolase [Caballeronia sordidicola]|uniref:MBL fold metallo-hydrolase n=1 Tax=Caballeronia sordidicola TaxID=196367 RepID=UPI0004D003C1|nr:MBL fold metallo-hydrolase [Caballeronia sordidicola]
MWFPYELYAFYAPSLMPVSGQQFNGVLFQPVQGMAMFNVHVFRSAESAFFVNSFIIETGRGLVLVDTQFLTSSARQLCEAIRAHGKPLLAVFITHPHPDHFSGTAEIVHGWPGLPIYATQATIDVIRTTQAEKRAAWTPVYGDDYPQETVLPNTVVVPGQSIFVDGLELRVDDLGEGESADITVIHLPQSDQLIASDLLYHRVHPWLAEGRTKQWLSQLEIVRERYSTATGIFAGHGEAAGPNALTQQAEYLNTFRNWVRDGIGDLRHPTHEEKSMVAGKVLQRYPNYPLQMLVEMNIDGVAKELAAEFESAR